MKIQRNLIAAAVSLGLLCTTTLQAGVPVVDGIANGLSAKSQADTLVQWGKEAIKWGKDYAHYASQLKAYADQFNDLRSGNYSGLITKLLDTYAVQGGALSGMVFGKYSEGDAESYLGKNNACEGVEGSEGGANAKACRSARNMQAKAMKDMEQLMKHAKDRTDQIEKLVKESQAANITPGQLQQKTIEMMGLQALLQNDLAKLQLTLEMHKQRQELYKQEQADSAAAIMKGNGKPIELGNVLSGLGDGFSVN